MAFNGVPVLLSNYAQYYAQKTSEEAKQVSKPQEKTLEQAIQESYEKYGSSFPETYVERLQQRGVIPTPSVEPTPMITQTPETVPIPTAIHDTSPLMNERPAPTQNQQYEDRLKLLQQRYHESVRLMEDERERAAALAQNNGINLTSDAEMRRLSPKFNQYASEAEQIAEEMRDLRASQAVPVGPVKPQDGFDPIGEADRSFSGITDENPMEKDSNVSPIIVPAETPAERADGTPLENTMVDPNFDLTDVIKSNPYMQQTIEGIDDSMHIAEADSHGLVEQPKPVGLDEDFDRLGQLGNSLSGTSAILFSTKPSAPDIDATTNFSGNLSTEGKRILATVAAYKAGEVGVEPVADKTGKHVGFSYGPTREDIPLSMVAPEPQIERTPLEIPPGGIDNTPIDKLVMDVSGFYRSKGEFLTGSGLVTTDVDPTSERGQRIQGIFAQQAKDRFENAQQREYVSKLREGKVSIADALLEPRTENKYFGKDYIQISEGVPRERRDQIVKYFQERGISLDEQIGSVRLTGVRYTDEDGKLLEITPESFRKTPDGEPLLAESSPFQAEISAQQFRNALFGTLSDQQKQPTLTAESVDNIKSAVGEIRKQYNVDETEDADFIVTYQSRTEQGPSFVIVPNDQLLLQLTNIATTKGDTLSVQPFNNVIEQKEQPTKETTLNNIKIPTAATMMIGGMLVVPSILGSGEKDEDERAGVEGILTGAAAPFVNVGELVGAGIESAKEGNLDPLAKAEYKDDVIDRLLGMYIDPFSEKENLFLENTSLENFGENVKRFGEFAATDEYNKSVNEKREALVEDFLKYPGYYTANTASNIFTFVGGPIVFKHVFKGVGMLAPRLSELAKIRVAQTISGAATLGDVTTGKKATEILIGDQLKKMISSGQIGKEDAKIISKTPDLVSNVQKALKESSSDIQSEIKSVIKNDPALAKIMRESAEYRPPATPSLDSLRPESKSFRESFDTDSTFFPESREIEIRPPDGSGVGSVVRPVIRDPITGQSPASIENLISTSPQFSALKGYYNPRYSTLGIYFGGTRRITRRRAEDYLGTVDNIIRQQLEQRRPYYNAVRKEYQSKVRQLNKQLTRIKKKKAKAKGEELEKLKQQEKQVVEELKNTAQRYTPELTAWYRGGATLAGIRSTIKKQKQRRESGLLPLDVDAAEVSRQSLHVSHGKPIDDAVEELARIEGLTDVEKNLLRTEIVAKSDKIKVDDFLNLAKTEYSNVKTNEELLQGKLADIVTDIRKKAKAEIPNTNFRISRVFQNENGFIAFKLEGDFKPKFVKTMNLTKEEEKALYSGLEVYAKLTPVQAVDASGKPVVSLSKAQRINDYIRKFKDPKADETQFQTTITFEIPGMEGVNVRDLLTKNSVRIIHDTDESGYLRQFGKELGAEHQIYKSVKAIRIDSEKTYLDQIAKEDLVNNKEYQKLLENEKQITREIGLLINRNTGKIRKKRYMIKNGQLIPLHKTKRTKAASDKKIEQMIGKFATIQENVNDAIKVIEKEKANQNYKYRFNEILKSYNIDDASLKIDIEKALKTNNIRNEVVRLSVLDAVASKPMTKNQLIARSGINNDNLVKNLERGLIESDGGKYKLTKEGVAELTKMRSRTEKSSLYNRMKNIDEELAENVTNSNKPIDEMDAYILDSTGSLNIDEFQSIVRATRTSIKQLPDRFPSGADFNLKQTGVGKNIKYTATPRSRTYVDKDGKRRQINLLKSGTEVTFEGLDKSELDNLVKEVRRMKLAKLNERSPDTSVPYLIGQLEKASEARQNYLDTIGKSEELLGKLDDGVKISELDSKPASKIINAHDEFIESAKSVIGADRQVKLQRILPSLKSDPERDVFVLNEKIKEVDKSIAKHADIDKETEEKIKRLHEVLRKESDADNKYTVIGEPFLPQQRQTVKTIELRDDIQREINNSMIELNELNEKNVRKHSEFIQVDQELKEAKNLLRKKRRASVVSAKDAKDSVKAKADWQRVLDDQNLTAKLDESANRRQIEELEKKLGFEPNKEERIKLRNKIKSLENEISGDDKLDEILAMMQTSEMQAVGKEQRDLFDKVVKLTGKKRTLKREIRVNEFNIIDRETSIAKKQTKLKDIQFQPNKGGSGKIVKTEPVIAPINYDEKIRLFEQTGLITGNDELKAYNLVKTYKEASGKHSRLNQRFTDNLAIYNKNRGIYSASRYGLVKQLISEGHQRPVESTLKHTDAKLIDLANTKLVKQEYGVPLGDYESIVKNAVSDAYDVRLDGSFTPDELLNKRILESNISPNRKQQIRNAIREAEGKYVPKGKNKIEEKQNFLSRQLENITDKERDEAADILDDYIQYHNINDDTRKQFKDILTSESDKNPLGNKIKELNTEFEKFEHPEVRQSIVERQSEFAKLLTANKQTDRSSLARSVQKFALNKATLDETPRPKISNELADVETTMNQTFKQLKELPPSVIDDASKDLNIPLGKLQDLERLGEAKLKNLSLRTRLERRKGFMETELEFHEKRTKSTDDKASLIAQLVDVPIEKLDDAMKAETTDAFATLSSKQTHHFLGTGAHLKQKSDLAEDLFVPKKEFKQAQKTKQTIDKQIQTEIENTGKSYRDVVNADIDRKSKLIEANQVILDYEKFKKVPFIKRQIIKFKNRKAFRFDKKKKDKQDRLFQYELGSLANVREIGDGSVLGKMGDIVKPGSSDVISPPSGPISPVMAARPTPEKFKGVKPKDLKKLDPAKLIKSTLDPKKSKKKKIGPKDVAGAAVKMFQPAYGYEDTTISYPPDAQPPTPKDTGPIIQDPSRIYSLDPSMLNPANTRLGGFDKMKTFPLGDTKVKPTSNVNVKVTPDSQYKPYLTYDTSLKTDIIPRVTEEPRAKLRTKLLEDTVPKIKLKTVSFVGPKPTPQRKPKIPIPIVPPPIYWPWTQKKKPKKKKPKKEKKKKMIWQVPNMPFGQWSPQEYAIQGQKMFKEYSKIQPIDI